EIEDNHNGTFTFSTDGAPAGEHLIGLFAENGVPNGLVTQVFINVGTRATVEPDQSGLFRIGHPGSFTVTAEGGDPEPFFYVPDGVQLPPGLALTADSDGVATISGTPAPGTAGVHAISLGFTNFIGDDQLVAVNLIVAPDPGITDFDGDGVSEPAVYRPSN